MDSVLDFLYLRRLKFEYVSPPICPITIASASGLAVTGQVISPILAMNAPGVLGHFVTWPCIPNGICYNIYESKSGILTEVASCIQPNTMVVCSSGCWQISAVVGGIEGPLSTAICTDGTELVTLDLPAAAGVEYYNVYKNDAVVLQGLFCGAFESCDLGCYSVSAITGDGETPPSPVSCTGHPPTVTMTSPPNGSADYLPSPVTVSASVTLNGNIASNVQFYANGVLIQTIAAPGPYSFVWTPPAPGTYTIDAVLNYASP